MQKALRIAFVSICLIATAHAAFTAEKTVTIIPDPQVVKGARILEIKQSPRFQRYVDEQAELRYYESLKQEAEEGLKEIHGTPENSKASAAAALRAFLAGKNPELAAQADYIVTLPRWVEAVAIMHKETTYCTRGVGESRNNCGGIKNLAGEFKYYASKIDGLEDISILLQKPRYKNLTIEAMNGIYCQDAARAGNRCEAWDTDIMRIVDELNGKIKA